MVRRLAFVLVSALLAATAPAYAAPIAGMLVAPADRGVAADVARARDLRDFGRIPPGNRVEIGVLLRVRNQAALERLILAQGDPASRYYHRYLTLAEWAASFAPTREAYGRAAAMLRRRGFRITSTFANRGMIRAVASAGIVERYFGTELHAVFQPKWGYRYLNVRPAIMPAELRGIAVSVAGLHSIVTVHHPLRFGNPAAIRRSASFLQALARVRRATRTAPIVRRRPLQPRALSTSTPSPPGPDASESPESPDTDYLRYSAYGPPIFAEGYDFPVQHGYGGRNHAAGSVVEADYLDADAASEFSAFGIPRTGTRSPIGFRRCTDPNGGPTCDGLIGAGDPTGEATLDAEAIMSLAPAADYFEYLAPSLDDLDVETAYEQVLNDDLVDAINSSFGGCETDNPSFEYATNFLAMEGAALGITFSASTGDTGAFGCGLYTSNGVPQNELDIDVPAGDPYFTAVGGTSYLPITPADTNDYHQETAWTYGGGGHSVFEPIPSWQAALAGQSSSAAMVSTTFRNIPDIAMAADPGTNSGNFGGSAGIGFVYCHDGTLGPAGGTSLASPMFVALQTEINEIQHSRNGFVNPSLYAMAAGGSTEYAFAFRDVVSGTNGFYSAQTGYDDATGIGSPKGWELAADEYGTPGATAAPSPTDFPPTPTPIATASPTPTPVPTPHPSGTGFAVTTIAGASCAHSDTSLDGTGNSSCFANPTGIVYVPPYATDAGGAGMGVPPGQADPTLFVSDFFTGFLRSYDLTTAAVVSEDTKTWNNATRTTPSQLYGLALNAGSSVSAAPWGGLWVLSAGDDTANRIALPTSPNPAATPHSAFSGLTGGVAAMDFNSTGNDAAITAATGTTLTIATFAGPAADAVPSSTSLGNRGNFGITRDGATPPNYVITDSGNDSIVKASDVPTSSTVSAFAAGAPLNGPKEITYMSGTGAFYVANCLGNDIVRVSATGAMTVVAGDGASRETDGANTGAEFNCPFGITNDGTNLYVTDAAGNTIRKITNVS